jgi:phosphoglycerol transferase MdoB-like AlkP superfamily enzyme
MKKKAIGLLAYIIFWYLFFIAARIIFLLTQFGETSGYSLRIILETFTRGFKMDLSAVCYIIVLPLLLMTGSLFIRGSWYKIILKIYSSIFIVFSSALLIGDAITYSYWGFRLEYFIIDYLKTPGEAAASANNLQIAIFAVSLFALSAVCIYLLNRLINRFNSGTEKTRYPLLWTLILLVFIVLLIIPMRGGLGVTTINPGSVYFSPSLFPNHAATNLFWNFGYSTAHRNPTKNPYNYCELSRAKDDTRFLTSDSGPANKVLNTTRPNILLFILESFGSYVVNSGIGDSVVTPRFREFISEGIYFTNIYASGSRTDKALPAILCGYPNLPTIQVIRTPKKTQSMPGIFKLLDSAGYKTSFWYGGDINFSNYYSLISTTGFRQTVTKDDFDPEYCNSKWGVHDDVLMKRLFDSLTVAKQPFGYGVLTLSSHEPFEVPMEPLFSGKDPVNMFKNSAHYTDKSLGEFIDRAKQTEWWKNTLVIIIADHCRKNYDSIPVYAEDIFRIPMLWIGGALEKKNLTVEKFGNQFDLPLTIARQLNYERSFPFSKDLLSGGSKSFAFYTYNEGFAFITDSAAAFYDAKLKASVHTKGQNSALAEKYGKSFLQVLFDDYLKR